MCNTPEKQRRKQANGSLFKQVAKVRRQHCVVWLSTAWQKGLGLRRNARMPITKMASHTNLIFHE